MGWGVGGRRSWGGIFKKLMENMYHENTMCGFHNGLHQNNVSFNFVFPPIFRVILILCKCNEKKKTTRGLDEPLEGTALSGTNSWKQTSTLPESQCVGDTVASERQLGVTEMGLRKQVRGRKWSLWDVALAVPGSAPLQTGSWLGQRQLSTRFLPRGSWGRDCAWAAWHIGTLLVPSHGPVCSAAEGFRGHSSARKGAWWISM